MPKNVIVGPDEFEIVLTAWLNEVDENVQEALVPNMRKACIKGKKRVVKESPKNASITLTKGPYSTGWSYKVRRTSRFEVSGVIYNKKYPGLVHLLEKGHAIRGGGRVSGKEHVSIAKKVAAEELQKLMEKALREAVE